MFFQEEASLVEDNTAEAGFDVYLCIWKKLAFKEYQASPMVLLTLYSFNSYNDIVC